PVAMHRLAHLPRRQEHVGAAVVADEEAETVAMALHPAGDEVELGGEQQDALAIGQELAVALHRRQAALQRLTLLGPHRQAIHELGGTERHAGLAQACEDRLAAWRRGGIPPPDRGWPVATAHRATPLRGAAARALVDKTG